MTPSRKAWWFALLPLLAACHSGSSTGPTTVSVRPSTSITFGTKGRSVVLHAAVLGTSGDTVTGRTFTWTSSNVAIVNVSFSQADSAVLTSTGSGATTVTVTSGGLKGTVNVTVMLVAASAIDSGDYQVVDPGRALSYPLVLLLKDSLGSPAIGDTVRFTVAGGGSIGATQAVSNANGRVSTSWTTGTSGAQTVTATTAGFTKVFHAEIVPITNTPVFSITVVNVGAPFAPAIQADFDSAAAFWSRVITGNLLPDSIGTDPGNPPMPEGDQGCGPGMPAIGPLHVDDVVILARVDSIDGPGGTLAFSGPCLLRTSRTNPDTTEATILGVMVFDSADLASLSSGGQFNLVIKHEMAHVLGFGTYWGGFVMNEPGNIPLYGHTCLQLPTTSRPGPDTYYNCPSALAYFDSIGGTTYTGGNKVPVENCAGIPLSTSCTSGTWNAHWRETVFHNELMTGYLDPGVPNPVSKMTIAQFRDMGYGGVDITKAEPYSQTFAAPSAFRLVHGTLNLGNDVMMPRFAKRPGQRPMRIGPARVR